jgi:hypothetical protein
MKTKICFKIILVIALFINTITSIYGQGLTNGDTLKSENNKPNDTSLSSISNIHQDGNSDLQNNIIPDAIQDSGQSFVPSAGPNSLSTIPEDKGVLDYVNPFSDITGLKPTQTDSQISDPVQDSLNKLSSTTASATAQAAPTFFDYDKAQRFIKSPCYTSLGYDPTLDSLQQEEKYETCESDKKDNNLGTVIIGITVLFALGILVYVGSKKTS